MKRNFFTQKAVIFLTAVLFFLLANNLFSQVKRDLFLTSPGYIAVEVLDDDLVHVEFSRSTAQPDLTQPLYTTPMILKKDYPGAAVYQKNGNTIQTSQLRIVFDPNQTSLTFYDLNSTPAVKLTSIKLIPAIPYFKNGFQISRQSFTHVYGLGQQYNDEGSMDGDWTGRIKRPGLHPSYTEQPEMNFGNAMEKMVPFDGFLGNTQLPIAYFLGKNRENYALFLDSQYKQQWDLTQDPWTCHVDSDQIHLYILSGPNLPDLKRDYMELVGYPTVPPKKAFGLWLSEYGYENWQEIDQILTSLRDNRFPIDGFSLDVFWFGGLRDAQSGKESQMGSLSWDKDHFPDPRNRLKTYQSDEGIGFIAIEEPYIDKSLAEHADMAGKNYLVKQSAGGPPLYISDNPWWGQGGMIDWTNPTAAAYWHDQKRLPLIQDGLIGHWTDLGEPEMYQSTAWYQGLTGINGDLHQHKDIHNLYNFYWSKSLYDGYQRNNTAQRPFILSRSGAPGIQRFGVAFWSADVGASMQGFSCHNNAQLHLSLAGIDYYGADVGGFNRNTLNSNLDELYTQWFASACAFDIPIRPHVRNETHDQDTAPDRVGWIKSNLANIRLRYELIPYFYSLAHQAHLTGDPVIPPLVYYFQEDQQVRQIGNQKMIGKDILVAALAEADQTDRPVYLPQGKWIHYHTNTAYQSDGKQISPFIALKNDKFQLPMFIQSGAIIPQMFVDENTMNSLGKRLDNSQHNELIIRVYPDPKETQFTLFEDDGISNGYLKGEVRTTLISQKQTDALANVSIAAAAGHYPGALDSRNNVIKLVHDYNVTVHKVTLNGSQLVQYTNLADFNQAAAGWYDTQNRMIIAKSGSININQDKELSFHFNQQAAIALPPVEITARQKFKENQPQTIRIDWDDVLDAETYRLYYTTDNSPPTPSSTFIAVTDSQFEMNAIVYNKTYQFALTALNSRGESILSEIVTVQAKEPPKSVFPKDQPLRLVGKDFAKWNVNNPLEKLKLVDHHTWQCPIQLKKPLTDSAYFINLNGSKTDKWAGNGLGTDTQLAKGGQVAHISLDAGNYLLQVKEGADASSPLHIKWLENNKSIYEQAEILCFEGPGWQNIKPQTGLKRVDHYTWQLEIDVPQKVIQAAYKISLKTDKPGSFIWGGADGTDVTLTAADQWAYVSLDKGAYLLQIIEGDTAYTGKLQARWIKYDQPPAPDYLYARPAGSDSIALNWSKVPTARSYTLYYTTDGSEPTSCSCSIKNICGTSYQHTALKPGKTYTYKLSASCFLQEGALSSPVQAEAHVPYASRLGKTAQLRLVGGYFSWSPAGSYHFKKVADHTWQLLISIKDHLENTQYKITLDGDWMINWGSETPGLESDLSLNAANAKITLEPGDYLIRLTEKSPQNPDIFADLHIQWLPLAELSDDFKTLDQWQIKGNGNKWKLVSETAKARFCPFTTYLTLKNSLALTKHCLLKFDMQTKLKANENLKLQVYNGSQWITIDCWCKSYAWINRTYDLSAYQNPDFKIRFSTKSKSITSFSAIDNVKLLYQ